MNKFALTTACIASAAALALTNVSTSDAHPTATVSINVTQGGFVIGGTSGHGHVRYHRRNYPVTISGLRIGAIVGASNAELSGRFTNLSGLADVEGTYSSVGASASIGSGRNVQQFQNSHGVVLELHGMQDGLEMSLDLGSMTIRLDN